MKRKEKYLIKGINFGKKGDPARQLIEDYIKKHGNMATSKLIRQLVVFYLSDKPEFEKHKIEALKFQRKQLKKQIYEIGKKLEKNADELEEAGYSLDFDVNLSDNTK